MLALISSIAHPAAGQRTVSRDSAGVRIIENDSRANAPTRFRLGAVPTLEVGGLEDRLELEFDHKQGFLNAVQLSSGIAVTDGNRIHYFDAAAKRIRIVGKKGQGPKEFSTLTSACVIRGDTLVVRDQNNRRFAIVDENGNVVRTFSQGDYRSTTTGYCFGDGTIALMRFTSGRDSSRQRVQIARVALDGRRINVIGDLTTPTFNMITQSTPDLAINGTELFYGDGSTGQVVVFNTLGRVLRIIRSSDPARSISKADAERRLQGGVNRVATPAQQAAWLARMRAKMPATWPSFGRIHVDPNANLWIQDYRLDFRVSDVWTAFDSSGRMIGRLAIELSKHPGAFIEVLGFGHREVVLRRYDNDGAAHIGIYPIETVRRVRPRS